MMNARAKASVALDIGDRRGAAQLVEKALGKIRAFYGDCGEPELLEHSPEVEFLEEWLEELKRMEPLTELQQMRQEMERAIASEAYERAAELRDAIRALENSK
jgi:excinuclease UvrABC helicase subunit UvrB